MTHHCRLLAIVAITTLVVCPTAVEARTTLRSRVAANSADAGQVVAAPGVPSPVIATPMPCQPRCIEYKSHRLRCKFDPCTAQKIILQVTDPCCCCYVEVPVCVPSCCTGVPEVCTRCGIFGRHIVEYTWCCGYEVKVIFDRCGDVTVHTYGL